MAIEKFDVFVIGSGKSGRDVASACAKAGKKVAIADNREFGGVCANRGCDPKKVLVSFTEILERSHNMLGKGITEMPGYSWKDLHKFKLEFTDAVPFVNERDLEDLGIKLYHQSPKFLDENTLSVEGKTVKAGKIVIATGQKHASLPIEGSQYLLTSDDFLDLKELPKSMIFIGAGYIGMELAHVAARCGVKVTIIHSDQRPLNNFDPDMVDHLVEVSEKIGIKFIFNATASRVEKLRKNYRVSAKQDDEIVTAKAEMVFNAAGRIPSIDELDLDKGGVTHEKAGITVDENLQNPGNKNVYACGDVAASKGMPLTPLAPIEGGIVISQLLDKEPKKTANYPPIPSVVFTLPNLASVGLSEEEANKNFKEIIVRKENATQWYSSKHLHDKIYAFKTIVDKVDGKILGVHMIGSGVGESINLFAMALAHEMTVEDVQKVIYAYPTWGRDVRWMF